MRKKRVILQKADMKVKDDINSLECLKQLALFLEETNRSNFSTKKKLNARYHEILAYINDHALQNMHESLFDFPFSSKWPELSIRTISIYGTLSGVASAFIPELITTGFLTLSFISIFVLTFVTPFLIVLPYLLHKSLEDMSKTERLLRAQEVILTTRQLIIDDMLAKGILKPSQASTNTTIASSIQRQNFNSTVLSSTYLAGTIFALGIAILTTFSLSTPVGWLVILLIAIAAGIGFYRYHNWHKQLLNKKHAELCQRDLTLRSYDDQLTPNLTQRVRQLEDENAHLKQEIEQTQSNNIALQKINLWHKAEIALLQKPSPSINDNLKKRPQRRSTGHLRTQIFAEKSTASSQQQTCNYSDSVLAL